MKRRQADKIRWIGLWYSLSGYWMGISAENDFRRKSGKFYTPTTAVYCPAPVQKR